MKHDAHDILTLHDLRMIRRAVREVLLEREGESIGIASMIRSFEDRLNARLDIIESAAASDRDDLNRRLDFLESRVTLLGRCLGAFPEVRESRWDQPTVPDLETPPRA